jgi:hypothetical protein
MPSAASRSGVRGVYWKSGPDQPTGRVPVACSTAAIASRIYCRSSSSDMPLWMRRRRERPCAMNSAPAPLPLLDQERVVVGNGLVERQGRRNAVLVQDGEDAEEADAIAVLVVAVAADIGKSHIPSSLVVTP